MEITGEGLVLGAGTLLARMARNAARKPVLLVDGEEERILALLSAAYGRSVPASVIGKLRKSSDLWSRGETALAHIHLSHAGFPPCDDQELAFRLFAANEVLEAGLSPRTLMKSLGLYPTPLDLLQKYNPDQPRVPGGSGRESGQWTSGDGGGAPRQTFVQRVEIRMAGATMSDANPPGIVLGAQYAQVSPTPIVTPHP